MTTRVDTLIRSVTVVEPGSTRLVDVAVDDGLVVALGEGLECEAHEVIDASGLHAMPGMVDMHVHLNEPGRSSWEGWTTGTAALAAAGTTTAVDMPVNSIPPTTTVAAFDAKRAVAEECALIDFGLWGGLQPDNVDEIEALHNAGAVGFKAFMCTTGLEEFVMVDDLALYDGMREAARVGALVAVHAENDRITTGLAGRAAQQGRRGIKDFLASRPVVSEYEAICRAIAIAEETDCSLHIVHVSTGAGVRAVAEARTRGVDVSCETCPHYLLFTADDVERIGALAKCTPPIRAEHEREALWAALGTDALPMVSSDHSPAPSDLKAGEDFFAIWGGIAGAQTALPVLLTAGHQERGIELGVISELTAGFPARRFAFPRKGRIEVGADADIVLVALHDQYSLTSEQLLTRVQSSPYVGLRFRGKVMRTLSRGATVARAQAATRVSRGRLVMPLGSRAGVRSPRATDDGQ